MLGEVLQAGRRWAPGSQPKPDKNPVSLFHLGAITLVSMSVGHGKSLGFSGTLGPLVRFREFNFRGEVRRPTDDANVGVCVIEQPKAQA